MRKVLVNLLLNARDAVNALPGKKYSGAKEVPASDSGTPEGEGAGECPISVSTSKSDYTVILEVSDRGCGMPEDFIRDRLFQAFQTTKQQGMGVGLFQSRMIVDAHKGRIEVDSEPGQGSTFRIFLPLAS